MSSMERTSQFIEFERVHSLGFSLSSNGIRVLICFPGKRSGEDKSSFRCHNCSARQGGGATSFQVPSFGRFIS